MPNTTGFNTMAEEALNQEQEASEGSFRAHCIGSLAYQELLKYRGSYLGQSLEVFPNSIYVRTRVNELLNFTRKAVKSPININFAGDGELRSRVEPRRIVHVSNENCFVDRMCVKVESAEIYYPKLRVAERFTSDLEGLSCDLLSTAFQTGIMYSREGVLNLGLLAHHSFSRFVEKAIESLGRLDIENFVKAASEIVGLGVGFTPAGDDLIAGFLGVFNTFAPALRLEPVILPPPILARTTWASGRLLDYMQRGLFDEEFGAVVDALVSPDGKALVDSLQNLASRGHTSGLDLCSGAITAAAVVLDLAFPKGLTKKIMAHLGYTNP